MSSPALPPALTPAPTYDEPSGTADLASVQAVLTSAPGWVR